MSKTLAPSVTTRDPKGRKFISVVEAAYNKARLSEDEAQRVNDTPGLGELVGEFIAENRSSNQFADEEVGSSYTYPSEYTGLKDVRKQVEALLAIPAFAGLDAAWALEHGQAWYDALALPDWIEGPLVYVWHGSLGGYHAALEAVLSAIATSRNFSNYREGQLTPDRLRQNARTAETEKALKTVQPGDLIVVPSQAGLRHRGRSVRRAREVFASNEFGLGAEAEGCRALTHPERFVRWDQLHVDCAGDEFRPGAGGGFSYAPCFRFHDGKVEFDARRFDAARGHYGSASGFLPQ